MQPKEAKRSIVLSSVEPKKIEWLWKLRIPMGVITVIEGDGGGGKSFTLAAVAAAVSRGSNLPDHGDVVRGNVLLLPAEDDMSVVLRPRFESSGADLERIHIYSQDILLNEQGFKDLREEVQRVSPRLIVIDPIVSFLGAKLDANSATDVRSVLKPLHQLAAESNCAIVIARHWNKASGASASHRGAGSVDFRNAARSVLQVIRTPEGRYLAHDKSNYGQTAKTLTFDIVVDGTLRWTGESEKSGDDILRSLKMDPTLGSEDSAKHRAVSFLRASLRQGPMRADRLLDAATAAGISKPTLERAKRDAPAKSEKRKDGWYWHLEEKNVVAFYDATDRNQDTQDDQPSLVAIGTECLDNLDHLDSGGAA